jgi:asparagine synthase (glutamine-hydrolysing)
MCGLVGFIADQPLVEKSELLVQVINRMMRAMSHRGFDGDGIFVDEQKQVFFGHKRLAIVNQNIQGIQPMTTPDRRYTIIFNGEIYNYKSLMVELGCHGIDIKSETDTEVLLHGFALWGTAFLKKIRGMFAFVIWDSVLKRAYLARDQFGIKPLYFAHVNKAGISGIVFASELKALLASDLIPRKVNKKALAEYFRYASIRAPVTMVQGVESLEPSTIMILKDGIKKVETIWDIGLIGLNPRWDSFETSVAFVRKKLIEVLAMYSDIPVEMGVFLSGGIDSTFLLAALTKIGGKTVSTFSLGFNSPGGNVIDESIVAKQTAKLFGSRHNEVRIDAIEARDAFSSFIHAIDQPSSDGFNTYLISRLAGRHSKVIFSGIGGDELFLGYRYFSELLNLQAFDKIPGSGMISHVAALICNSFKSGKSVARRLGYGFLQHGNLRKDELYKAYRSIPGFEDSSQLLSFDLRAGLTLNFDVINHQLHHVFTRESDLLNAFSKAELNWYVPGVLVRDTDAVSMASTIEARIPFLDIELVEAVLSMPSKYKRWSKQSVNKPLLVQAFKELFPLQVVAGSKKGFEMPLGFWLKENFKDKLQDLKDTPWLNKKEIERLSAELYADPREYRKLWSVMVLANWVEQNDMSF